MENSINEERIKRFGKITVLNIDNVIECGYIKICKKNDYTKNIIVIIDEIMSLYALSYSQKNICLETQNNKLTYKGGYLKIENPYESLIFTKEDFIEFGDYIYELVNGGITYEE